VDILRRNQLGNSPVLRDNLRRREGFFPATLQVSTAVSVTARAYMISTEGFIPSMDPPIVYLEVLQRDKGMLLGMGYFPQPKWTDLPRTWSTQGLVQWTF